MSKARKTWQEKLADDKDFPRVVEIKYYPILADTKI